MWDKTNDDIKSLGALNSMPLYLNTRNASVASIKNFTDKDRTVYQKRPGVDTDGQRLKHA